MATTKLPKKRLAKSVEDRMKIERTFLVHRLFEVSNIDVCICNYWTLFSVVIEFADTSPATLVTSGITHCIYMLIIIGYRHRPPPGKWRLEDLGHLWQGRGGSLCCVGVHSLSPLVLLGGGGQSPGMGCLGALHIPLLLSPQCCCSPHIGHGSSPFNPGPVIHCLWRSGGMK